MSSVGGFLSVSDNQYSSEKAERSLCRCVVFTLSANLSLCTFPCKLYLVNMMVIHTLSSIFLTFGDHQALPGSFHCILWLGNSLGSNPKWLLRPISFLFFLWGFTALLYYIYLAFLFELKWKSSDKNYFLRIVNDSS